MLEARSLFFIIEKYALELIANIGLASANFISTPMELNLKLTSTKFDHHILSYQKDPLLDNSTGDQRFTVFKSIYALSQSVSHECNS